MKSASKSNWNLLTVRNVWQKPSAELTMMLVSSTSVVGATVSCVLVGEKSCKHSKDFPSSHPLNLAFVDLLHPFRAHLAVGKVLRRKIPRAGIRLYECFSVYRCVCVDVFHRLFYCSLVSFVFSFFTSFKATASIVEQLKVSFRRCYTYFSTAEARKKSKEKKLKKSWRNLRRKFKVWKSIESSQVEREKLIKEKSFFELFLRRLLHDIQNQGLKKYFKILLKGKTLVKAWKEKKSVSVKASD